MDLTKTLPHNYQDSASVTLFQQSQYFFTSLVNQIQTDLKLLQTQKDLTQQAYFNKIRVLQGNFIEKKLATSIEKKYLFLQLPNTPGFLIESEGSYVYKMYRATKVNPILNSALGEMSRPEIFVLKSDVLEEFKVLDDCFVRTTTSDKTLSVEQMSEMLLLLAESIRLY